MSGAAWETRGGKGFSRLKDRWTALQTDGTRLANGQEVVTRF